jgi:hypothetical protein
MDSSFATHLSPLEQDILTWTAIDRGRRIVFASFTLMVYEYFITLELEVCVHFPDFYSLSPQSKGEIFLVGKVDSLADFVPHGWSLLLLLYSKNDLQSTESISSTSYHGVRPSPIYFMMRSY